MSTDSSRCVQLSGSGSGVHGNGLSNNEAIADQLSDGLSRIGILNFVALRGIKPDLALSTADD